MADKAALAAGKYLLKNKMGKQPKLKNQNDKYCYVPASNGRGSKKVRKDVEYYTHLGIPEHDAKILVTVKDRARFLDSGLKIPGVTKIGISSFVALIPVVGDFADTGLAYLLVIRKASQISKGKDGMRLQAIMYRNLTIDFAIGLVPIVGDIVDTLYRCNTKNAQALEDLLIARVALTQKANQEIEKTGKVHRAPVQPIDVSEPRPDLPPQYESSTHSSAHGPPIKGQRSKSTGGWLASLRGRRTHSADVVEDKDVTPPRPVRPIDTRQQRNVL